jgi:hypothetical protein
MRILALSLLLALSLPNSAFATVFAGTHSLVIVGDGVVNGGLVAPPGFFDDIPAGTPVIGSSQYDDTASQLFGQCFNPSDPADCYPVYGGGSFSLSIDGVELSTDDFGDGGPFVVLDDQWVFDPATGIGLPPFGVDFAGLTFFQPGAGGYERLGSGDRWVVELVSLYLTLDADTFSDPASIAAVDFYALGDMILTLTIRDSQTGNVGTVFAVVPEPSTALLLGLGLGLTGLAGRGRSRNRS